MVRCFAADCDHISKSHHCCYFHFPKEKDVEYKISFDVWVSTYLFALALHCLSRTAPIRAFERYLHQVSSIKL